MKDYASHSERTIGILEEILTLNIDSQIAVFIALFEALSEQDKTRLNFAINEWSTDNTVALLSEA